MAEIKCEKCGEFMKKIGSLNCSNSKFDQYSCPSCNHTKQTCAGLIK